MTKNEVLAWLKKTGTRAGVDAMKRYGIDAKVAYGVPMNALLKKSKEIGKDHALSLVLWDTGCYEARLLAALIGDPKKLTRAQMDAWAWDFENWADGDTACFKLFDQTPLAWEAIESWAKAEREFTKRGAFALIASLALHDKTATDAQLLGTLRLIEEGAQDDRNFVKKGVNWALRSVGSCPSVKAAVVDLATRLSRANAPAPRWVGADALRQLRKRDQQAKDKVAKTVKTTGGKAAKPKR